MPELNEAISLGQEAVQLTPSSDSLHPEHVTSLADSLLEQFQQSGKRTDLDEAICLH
jgi:hypothetical protein